jgi:predicted membrane protein
MSTTTSSRAASLPVALGLCATLLLYPRIVGTRLGTVEHSALPMLLLGVSGAFVSGLGYRPENRIARVLFSQGVSWGLMGFGIGILAIRRLTA